MRQPLWAGAALLGTLLAAACAMREAEGQRLAQRNWEGSGLSADAWWTRGIFCRVDLRRGDAGGLKGVTARLDALMAAGCDALELGLLAAGDPAGSPFAAAYGSMDDAEGLIEEAGRHRMRLVLDLPMPPAGEEAVDTRMRFWLSRGVAGFVVEGSGATGALLHRMRQVMTGAVGTRVLIGGEGTSGEVQLAVRRLAGPPGKDRVAGLRAQLAAVGPGALLAGSGVAEESPRAMAAVLLARGTAVELEGEAIGGVAPPPATKAYAAEDLRLWIPQGEASPEGLADWIGRLSELHRGNSTLRTGSATQLDHDAEEVLVWVVRPKGAGAPVVVACNLSGHAVRVAVGSELRGLGMRGTYLKTLLRSDVVVQPATLDRIELPADGVLVGEIR